MKRNPTIYEAIKRLYFIIKKGVVIFQTDSLEEALKELKYLRNQEAALNRKRRKRAVIELRVIYPLFKREFDHVSNWISRGNKFI